MDTQSPSWRLERITRGLIEVVGQEEIAELLKDPTKEVKIYWGTATTGKPHFGYFVPIYKIYDFLTAGAHVTILFANLHGFLDNMKSTWELLEARAKWYEFIIKAMLSLVEVDLSKLQALFSSLVTLTQQQFIRGTEYQLSKEYTADVYKFTGIVTLEGAKRAGADVVKKAKYPLLSSMLYPLLQSLDEQFLQVDIQFGGLDQKKIFMFSRENLTHLGYKKRAHLMNPLIPGLGESGQMSSSEPLSKFDFDDTDEQIALKLKSAFSIDGQVEKNGMLSMLEHVLFRYLEKNKRPFVVPLEDGKELAFDNFKDVASAFAKGEFKSQHLKAGMTKLVCEFIAPLRTMINQHLDLMKTAYPPGSLSHTKSDSTTEEKKEEATLSKEEELATISSFIASNENNDVGNKLKLMMSGIQSVIGEDVLVNTLKQGTKPHVCWLVPVTGKPHFFHYIALTKILDFLKGLHSGVRLVDCRVAGCRVTILLGDIHGYLDHVKCPWELMKERADWYELTLKAMLSTLGVKAESTPDLKFVRGSDHQLNDKYALDMYKLSAMVTTEVTLQASSPLGATKYPLMSAQLYPLLAALDEEYVGADAIFGGAEFQQMYSFADTYLPKLGYKRRAHLMFPEVSALKQNEAFGISDVHQLQIRIELDDSKKAITTKINAAYSLDGQPQGNVLLMLLKIVLFPLLQGKPLHINRPDKFGGPLQFNTYEEVEEAFKGTLVSADLKPVVIQMINDLLTPVRDAVQKNSKLLNAAFPKSKVVKEAVAAYAMDIRVGKIVNVEKQSGSENVYIAKVDVGSDSLRSISCNFGQHIQLEELKDKLVPVVCNLQPSEFKGSEGVVLIASTLGRKSLALIQIPSGAQVGDKVHVDGETGEPDSPFLSKAKWGKLIKQMNISGGVIRYKEKPLICGSTKLTTEIADGVLG